MTLRPFPLQVFCLLLVTAFYAQAAVTLRGERRQWHRLTLVFDGPAGLRESNPATFLNHRLDVTFRYKTKSWVVPGYYAADGNAANTGAKSGKTWHCHFAPSEIGRHTWTASFRKGNNVAVRGGGRAQAPINRLQGSFLVKRSNKSGRDHRGMGRLEYVGKHHLRFAGSKKYFLKTGADSPENFLAFADFDNTGNYKNLRKTYRSHISDWRPTSPSWRGGMGKGIIGALNYQSKMGMNVQSFLLMNVRGDDRNVYPYVTNNTWTTFDVSKLAQWEIVFEHMDKLGMYLHFKLMETENDDLLPRNAWLLYYREVVARFSHHLALNWNLGEESMIDSDQRRFYANALRALDPYSNHIVVHTKPKFQKRVYAPILRDISNGVRSSFTGASLQSGNQEKVHAETIYWLKESEAAGRPWAVASDETGPGTMGVLPDHQSPDNHHAERANILYGNMMAGGAGCETYFGYRFAQSDLTAQNFRSREQWWKQSRVARTFFETHVPFWNMESMDKLATRNALVLGQRGHSYAIYLKKGGSTTIDLRRDSTSYKVRWYNAATGGALKRRKIKCVRGNRVSSVGTAPTNLDWIVLLTAGCS